MSYWLTRLLIYVVVLFLIMVVYAGQRHDDAAGTARSAVRMTGKGMVYTGILVAAILALELLFID